MTWTLRWRGIRNFSFTFSLHKTFFHRAGGPFGSLPPSGRFGRVGWDFGQRGGRKREYGLIGWVYKGRVIGALIKAETNSIELCEELITRAWEIKKKPPVDIRPRNRKKYLGTTGLTISRCLSFFLIFFLFHVPLPSLIPSLPLFKAIAVITSLSGIEFLPPFTWGNRKAFGWSGSNKLHTNYHLLISIKEGRAEQISYKLTYANHHHHTPYTFIYLFFSCPGAMVGVGGRSALLCLNEGQTRLGDLVHTL